MAACRQVRRKCPSGLGIDQSRDCNADRQGAALSGKCLQPLNLLGKRIDEAGERFLRRRNSTQLDCLELLVEQPRLDFRAADIDAAVGHACTG
ncbi:hypothetical protein D3C87_2010620 [compost metagenome]